MELFSQCLHAWMAENNISTAAVTKLLDYKSKTSVLRALRGESNYAAYHHMFVLLAPSLNPAWQERFRAALTVERIGAPKAAMFEALGQQLFGDDAAEAAPALPLPPGPGRLMILGFPHPGLFGMLDRFFALYPDAAADHWVTPQGIQLRPRLLAGLIGHIPSLRYQAKLVPMDLVQSSALVWNVALYLPAAGDGAWGLAGGIDPPGWHRLDDPSDIAQTLTRQLAALPTTPLYRFDELKSGADYTRFIEDAYRIERGRTAVIVKPTPGLQMLPSRAVESAFRDYLAANTEPVAAMQEKLISVSEKRMRNFYHRSKPTLLCFSSQAMAEFARTGTLSDQFFALRPYTAQERIMCLEALRAFAAREDVRLYLRDGPAWPVSFEAYGGSGVLLYPSRTSYNSLYSAYRELFLPGETFSTLFQQFTEECLLPARADQSLTLDHLIAAIKTGG